MTISHIESAYITKVRKLTARAMRSEADLADVAKELGGLEIKDPSYDYLVGRFPDRFRLRSEAAVMVAIAKKVLPKEWDWTVNNYVNHTELVILSTKNERT